MLKIAIVAGEASGDILAAGLMHELKTIVEGPVEFLGVGGQHMALQGLDSQFPMDKLSLFGMGFDVLIAIPKLLWLRHKLIKQIIRFKPDVFIGVDAPDFNLYIEKQLKKSQIKTVHYVSPSIWAWRYERIFKLKGATDLVLCIFPMELSYYAKESIAAKYVGHTMADTIPMDVEAHEYKIKLGLINYQHVFSVLIGSRLSEITALSKILIEACNLIALQIPNSIFLFPLHNQSLADKFNTIISGRVVNFTYQILINVTDDAIKASDLILSKSGTICLNVALYKKPMVIFYKISWLSYFLFRHKITCKYVGLPNIILDELVVQECLQQEANPKTISEAFLSLYNDKARQVNITTKFHELHKHLKQNANYQSAKNILALATKNNS